MEWTMRMRWKRTVGLRNMMTAGVMMILYEGEGLSVVSEE
jgi:hypothetical protein